MKRDPLLEQADVLAGAMLLAILCMFLGFLYWIASPMADLWLNPHVKIEGFPPIRLQYSDQCRVVSQWDTSIRIYVSQGKLVAQCEGPPLRKEEK